MGAGSALPCPALPGEAGLGAGAGAGAAGGGVVRPDKNEGGGGREAHLVPLPGAPGDRAAPVGAARAKDLRLSSPLPPLR